MESGFKENVPCHTVTMACISSNAAVSTGKNILSSYCFIWLRLLLNEVCILFTGISCKEEVVCTYIPV